MTEKTLRYFRVQSSPPLATEIYHGRTPIKVARKAFTQFCRQHPVPKGSTTFTLTEIISKPIVRQRRKKIYKYALSRVKLEEPIVRRVPSGKEFVITYRTVVQSI